MRLIFTSNSRSFRLLKKIALVNHIIECYQLILSLDVELFYYYANKLCRAKGDYTLIKKNWYYKFYERNPSVKILKTRSMEKARLINEDLNDYIKWFRVFIKIVNK